MTHTFRIDDHSPLDMRLAFYAAPTMLGIKPASLFWCELSTRHLDEQIDGFNRNTRGKGYVIERIDDGRKHVGVFVFRRPLLKRYLDEPHRAAFLRHMGYPISLSPEEKLQMLFERIKTRAEFPHEIGLFLGYPIHDVKGYIIHKGRNYVLRGSWLVYSDAAYASRIFSMYRLCRDWLVENISSGMNISEILDFERGGCKR